MSWAYSPLLGGAAAVTAAGRTATLAVTLDDATASSAAALALAASLAGTLEDATAAGAGALALAATLAGTLDDATVGGMSLRDHAIQVRAGAVTTTVIVP